MLNDTIIVQSAISAFNNAALVMPAFLWSAILAVPLFVITYWCKDAILARLGWKSENLLNRVTTWSAILTLVWVILFSGNYAVLRDSLSVLPFMVATIVFLTALFASSHLRKYPLPKRGWRFWLLVLCVLITVGMADMHTWWGPLLQIGALGGGLLLGRIAKADMRPYSGTILYMLATSVAMLMQPEFFRFGQLGNLGVAHLIAMLAIGICAMATIAIQNVPARGKVRRSVYIKFKWLMRVIGALGGALFILTEAVPVFLGTLVAIFLGFALSVWHADKVNVHVADKTFAIVMMVFGVITTIPVITCLGILFWNNGQHVDLWADSKKLL